jgi:hypothetical protein
MHIFAYDGDNVIEETNSSGGVVARYSQGHDVAVEVTNDRTGRICSISRVPPHTSTVPTAQLSGRVTRSVRRAGGFVLTSYTEVVGRLLGSHRLVRWNRECGRPRLF